MSKLERIIESLGLGKKRGQPPAQFISPLDQRLAEHERQQKEATIKAQDFEKIEELRRDAIRLDFQNEVINAAITQWQETIPEDLITLFDEFAIKAEDKLGGQFTKKMLVRVDYNFFSGSLEESYDDWREKETILKRLRDPEQREVFSIKPMLKYESSHCSYNDLEIFIEGSGQIKCHITNQGQYEFDANTREDREKIIGKMVNILSEPQHLSGSNNYDQQGDGGN